MGNNHGKPSGIPPQSSLWLPEEYGESRIAKGEDPDKKTGKEKVKAAHDFNQQSAVPQTAESGCTVKDVKTQGNTVTWTVVCKEGMSTSTGKVAYAGSGMDGVVETTVKTGGQTMTMKSTMKGKRIGPCQ